MRFDYHRSLNILWCLKWNVQFHKKITCCVCYVSAREACCSQWQFLHYSQVWARPFLGVYADIFSCMVDSEDLPFCSLSFWLTWLYWLHSQACVGIGDYNESLPLFSLSKMPLLLYPKLFLPPHGRADLYPLAALIDRTYSYPLTWPCGGPGESAQRCPHLHRHVVRQATWCPFSGVTHAPKRTTTSSLTPLWCWKCSLGVTWY